MPTPIAKGIIISVAALVAAGIAVYESPQFRQWVNNSRRKIAIALHNLGDEIHPRDANSPVREDISMIEEAGPAAEERRRIALEEIQRRASLIEARRKRREGVLLGSFDALVDESGNLLASDSPEASAGTLGNSTAVDLGTSQPIQRGVKQPSISTPVGEGELINTASDRDRLHIDIPSPKHRSDSLVELTPTSEATDSDFFPPVHESSGEAEQSESSHTEEHPEIFYAHPDSLNNETNRDLQSPFSELSELGSVGFGSKEGSSAQSTAGSFSHIDISADDASSDGTLSDLGQTTGGISTPASWSEVGSVVSNDDLGHHGY